jgi:four helix bundle protein
MSDEPKAPIRSYRDLNVWQKAVELAEEAYRLAKKLPKVEEYGLGSQMRRAAVSVPANIAEGHGRRGNREFARFLGIAHGSLVEIETLVALGNRLGYYTAADAAKANELASHTGAMLWGLTKALDKQARGPAAAVSRQSSALAAVG